MPTISVGKLALFDMMGESFTDEEFDELCFEFGIELDDITTETIIQEKEQGKNTKGKKMAEEEIIYKIDVPANRYDLLCIEGISRALKIFRNRMQIPNYTIKNVAEERITLKASPEVLQIRPFVVSAVLRGVTFTEASYKSFIDLQDKLHQNICRERTLVAIGTHDLDTIQGPFTYEALAPEEIEFVPLNQEQKMNGVELMNFYENDQKLKHYLHIIRDSPVFPVIYDANRTVLSLPPIINGDHSKISVKTRNVFVECTATDYTKAKIVLNTVITMFSQYCDDAFTCEEVEVTQGDGTVVTLPQLDEWDIDARVSYINGCISSELNLSAEDCCDLLLRMALRASVKDAETLTVSVPPTRSDILHECDVMEDVAIAYGFNNIVKHVPQVTTIGKELPLNQITDSVRNEMAQAGFTEVLTMALLSREDNYGMINKQDDNLAVTVANPKTIDYQVVRTSLIPGILKTMESNQYNPLPLRLFEVSDVLEKSDEKDVGSTNIRKVCALYCNTHSGFEKIHGLLDRLMHVLSIPDSEYTLEASDNTTFFEGRCANVVVKGTNVGVIGVIHPRVLKNLHNFPYPCSVFEVNLQQLESMMSS